LQQVSKHVRFAAPAVHEVIMALNWIYSKLELRAGSRS
jgi:hypothetical protein